ncbi:hypothetical protein FQR65_LT18372 [Abscondita terminalis]|nr:hypothetical protein FQR65_LT18372 [Abscondita terminalis]
MELISLPPSYSASTSSILSFKLSSKPENINLPYVECQGVRITPHQMIFDNAIEGKSFYEKFTIQNTQNTAVFIRVLPANSYAFRVKAIPRGIKLSPGLSLDRYISYQCLRATSVCNAFVPIYINDERIEYKVLVANRAGPARSVRPWPIGRQRTARPARFEIELSDGNQAHHRPQGRHLAQRQSSRPSNGRHRLACARHPHDTTADEGLGEEQSPSKNRATSRSTATAAHDRDTRPRTAEVAENQRPAGHRAASTTVQCDDGVTLKLNRHDAPPAQADSSSS